MKTAVLRVRLNEDEMARIKTEATHLRLSVSDFVRRRLFEPRQTLFEALAKAAGMRGHN